LIKEEAGRKSRKQFESESFISRLWESEVHMRQDMAVVEIARYLEFNE
jgi:hypothetical protein